jgi:hypothetical protein
LITIRITKDFLDGGGIQLLISLVQSRGIVGSFRRGSSNDF